MINLIKILKSISSNISFQLYGNVMSKEDIINTALELLTKLVTMLQG